jgi:hypothetical protein
MTLSLDYGESLTMVGRFLAAGSRARLTVKVNGTEVGIMEIEERPGWQEPKLALIVPATGSSETQVQIDCQGADSYQAYHYWFFRQRAVAE